MHASLSQYRREESQQWPRGKPPQKCPWRCRRHAGIAAYVHAQLTRYAFQGQHVKRGHSCHTSVTTNCALRHRRRWLLTQPPSHPFPYAAFCAKHVILDLVVCQISSVLKRLRSSRRAGETEVKSLMSVLKRRPGLSCKRMACAAFAGLLTD